MNHELSRVLRGSLSIIPLPDLLNLLAISSKSGRLGLEYDSGSAHIDFLEGQILRIRTCHTMRLLGGLLLRDRLVTAEQWADLSCMDIDGLDVALCQDDILNPISYAELMRELTVEDLSRLMNLDDAMFTFEEDTHWEGGPVQVTVPVDYVMFNALQRRDERRHGRINPDGLMAQMRPLLGKLIELDGDQVTRTITLKPGTMTFGSDNHHDITIPSDPQDPPVYARICLTGRRYFLDDLSRAGTVSVNGTPIEQRALEDGDEILLGVRRFLFHRVAVD